MADGFENIANVLLRIYNSTLRLEDDECFHGALWLENCTIDLAEHTFIIKDNVDFMNSYLVFNGGYLQIEGNYSMLEKSSIVMKSESDWLHVDGDLNFLSEAPEIGYFSEGIIEVGGNFYQKGKGDTFFIGEEFTLAFVGEETQLVYVENLEQFNQFRIPSQRWTSSIFRKGIH